MNISPNYCLKSFNSNVSTQQLQTNPSFGIKSYVTPAVTILTGTAASALAAQLLVNLNTTKTGRKDTADTVIEDNNKLELPSRDEFKNMMKNLGFTKSYTNTMLDKYDINAYKAFDDYNLIKQIVESEDDNGLQIFSCRDAFKISKEANNFSRGLTKMLELKDNFGNLRFENFKDYVAAEVFEKYPAEAEKYADLKDEMGNFRFCGKEIDEIVKAKVNNIFKPEDIDNILNLKRNDGCYVFNKLPDCNTIESYIKEPELFTEICNIKTPNNGKYVKSDFISRLIPLYKQYPEETKHLLQMSGFDELNSRFSEKEIIDKSYNLQKIYKNAPRTFRTLASLRTNDDNKLYRFNLSGICEIIKYVSSGGEISEFSKENIRTINELSKISVDDGYLNVDNICKLFYVYKHYPEETREIMNNYSSEDEDGDVCTLIPSEEDVKLYIENCNEFNKKYS